MAFGYYKSVTLDHTQAGTADSTNWPLTIGLGVGQQAADANLKTVGNGGHVQSSSGYDIRPYADAALTIPLTYELVFYDGATGSLEMHVKISTLSHTSDTVIYLAYGNAALTTDGSSNTTWDANFGLVSHFKDGSSLSLADSSQNGNAGTNQSATAGAGNIDGGIVVSPTGPKYATYADSNSLDSTSALTVSVWANANSWSVNNTYRTLVKKNGNYIFRQGSDNGSGVGVYAFWFDNTNLKYAVFTQPSTGAWHQIVFTVSANALSGVYVDGAAQTLTVTTFFATGRVLTNPLGVGSDESGTGGASAEQFDGTLDEIRISNVDRGASWILADYNSQKASSTFITWGSETPAPAATGNFFSFF